MNSLYIRPNDSLLKKDTSMPEKIILTLKRDLADLEKLRSFLDEIRQSAATGRPRSQKPCCPKGSAIGGDALQSKPSM